jgi:hypothetical protein
VKLATEPIGMLWRVNEHCRAARGDHLPESRRAVAVIVVT